MEKKHSEIVGVASDLHPLLLNHIFGGLQLLDMRFCLRNTHSSCAKCGGQAAAQLRPHLMSKDPFCPETFLCYMVVPVLGIRCVNLQSCSPSLVAENPTLVMDNWNLICVFFFSLYFSFSFFSVFSPIMKRCLKMCHVTIKASEDMVILGQLLFIRARKRGISVYLHACMRKLWDTQVSFVRRNKCRRAAAS